MRITGQSQVEISLEALLEFLLDFAISIIYTRFTISYQMHFQRDYLNNDAT